MDGDHAITLRTRQLALELSLADGAIRWATRAGQPFAADSPGRAYAYDRVGKAIWHYMEHRADEYYYGFGERAGEMDKAKRRMRMLNLDALGYSRAPAMRSTSTGRFTSLSSPTCRSPMAFFTTTWPRAHLRWAAR